MPPRRSPSSSRALRLSVAAAVIILAAGCNSGARHQSTDRRPGPSTTASGAAEAGSTTLETTTTVDPGTLPQTTALPTQSDPLFQSRLQALSNAIVDGNPTEGLVAFFPLSAYIQVKAIGDPVHDYQTRLMANFSQDIQALHSSVEAHGGSASLVSVSVPAAAEWIKPGVEYNKGSYWRVYGTIVTYVTAGQRHSFEIHSLISWRGEWYVVHLGPIR